MRKAEETIQSLTSEIVKVISETNGISLNDTLTLLRYNQGIANNPLHTRLLNEFINLIKGFQNNEVDIDTLLTHPLSEALFRFFKAFPLPYYEDHIHLTGSLSAEFIFPRLIKLLNGPNAEIYREKIQEVYGEEALPIESVEDVDRLIRLKEGEHFKTYLKILYLPKLVLNSRKAHEDAAYHMASELYQKYNVGNIRLKFTLSRSTQRSSEQIPGLENVTEEDVVFGLYDGFKKFQKQVPIFNFILSPCFRKELDFFDSEKYQSKKEHFEAQVDTLLELIERFPYIKEHLNEVDTVGDERELYRKKHFEQLRSGLRKLQYSGFRIRSHHGETWKNLRKGIQSVDNSMNIWHLDALEHGLSLGINPNFYFHRLFQRISEKNSRGEKIQEGSSEHSELMDMDWQDHEVREKLLKGTPLNESETISFIKTKFHTAREVEHYQHDVLNHMINKKVTLISLPSSNLKLTESLPDYKDHPFSWWEKKGVSLGVGTDNYITLSTNYIQEMLILLYSDPQNLKITKLLMVCTKEKRRPFISHLLWELRKVQLGKVPVVPTPPPAEA